MLAVRHPCGFCTVLDHVCRCGAKGDGGFHVYAKLATGKLVSVWSCYACMRKQDAERDADRARSLNTPPAVAAPVVEQHATMVVPVTSVVRQPRRSVRDGS